MSLNLNQPWVSQLIQLAALALGGWFVRKHTRPTDHDRAAHLARIAEDTASLVMSLNPKADWATLLQMVVTQLVTASGLDITDHAALERAAAGALARLGRAPLT